MDTLQMVLGLIIWFVGELYVLAVLLRFILQLIKADFYNPISQAVVKVTNPPLIPLRRIIPSVAGSDTASLALALLVQIALVYLISLIGGVSPLSLHFGMVIVASIAGLLGILLNFYMFAGIIIAIASFIAPGSYSPALMLLNQLFEPMCKRIRQVIPPLGGLDFSIMVVFLGIYVLKLVTVHTLKGIALADIGLRFFLSYI
ncbi:YggT family protein [Spartinivicinus poritis]|uniref:YggT family protein n=1 Tax=Spartinivicinus poritis TaxID=2994640 RepID=A0ABT5UAV2_9GAMM|nr:YggT family protein [Spartinivicinus sp. A2-2]MDE1463305.1 YggT family protein [Spartinivicinus sp. A2-2]